MTKRVRLTLVFLSVLYASVVKSPRSHEESEELPDFYQLNSNQLLLVFYETKSVQFLFFEKHSAHCFLSMVSETSP